MSRLGLNAKTYRNTGTHESPTWTELTNIVDLTDGDEMEEADVTTRASGGFGEYEPTIRNLSLEFQMVNKAGDTDLAAIRTAYTTRAAIELLILEGPIAEVGVKGVRASYKVFSFAKGQELRNAQMIDVTLKPCSSENAPADYTVAE